MPGGFVVAAEHRVDAGKKDWVERRSEGDGMAGLDREPFPPDQVHRQEVVVQLVPGRRVVFTYGWERTEVQIPPGSTTVEIDLLPRPDGSTLLKLIHRGLDDLAADAHHGGWTHYLDRLRTAAEGTPPGPDPFADRRVPTPKELTNP